MRHNLDPFTFLDVYHFVKSNTHRVYADSEGAEQSVAVSFYQYLQKKNVPVSGLVDSPQYGSDSRETLLHPQHKKTFDVTCSKEDFENHLMVWANQWRTAIGMPLMDTHLEIL